MELLSFEKMFGSLRASPIRTLTRRKRFTSRYQTVPGNMGPKPGTSRAWGRVLQSAWHHARDALKQRAISGDLVFAD